MRWAGYVALMAEMRIHTIFWLENLNGRPRRRWENNIIVDFGEIRWEEVDWIHLAWERDQ
jgi:hypothetical protein